MTAGAAAKSPSQKISWDWIGCTLYTIQAANWVFTLYTIHSIEAVCSISTIYCTGCSVRLIWTEVKYHRALSFCFSKLLAAQRKPQQTKAHVQKGFARKGGWGGRGQPLPNLGPKWVVLKILLTINEEESARLGEGGLGWVGLKSTSGKAHLNRFFFAAAYQVFFIAVK